MNSLLNMGKNYLKGKSKHNNDEGNNEGEEGGSSSGDKKGFNPLNILKTFDRDGDGNITENGESLLE